MKLWHYFMYEYGWAWLTIGAMVGGAIDLLTRLLVG